MKTARSSAFRTDIEFMHAAKRVPDIPSARMRGSCQWDGATVKAKADPGDCLLG